MNLDSLVNRFPSIPEYSQDGVPECSKGKILGQAQTRMTGCAKKRVTSGSQRVY